MKTSRLPAFPPRQPGVRCLTLFGRACLIRTADGRFEVRGGNRTDQTPVREWISLFEHEAVPRFFPD